MFMLDRGRSGRGGWGHLATQNLVDYVSYSDSEPMGGTGSVTPLPDGTGRFGAWQNSMTSRGVTVDPQLRRWTSEKMFYRSDTTRSYRDQARPLQAKNGQWYSMIGCDSSMTVGHSAAVCQFKAHDRALTNWTFDRPLITLDQTLFGQPFSFGEVPDFFPLTSASGTTRHVLTICTVNHPVHCPGGWPEHGSLHWHCWIVHAVEYVVGDWSHDGQSFTPLQRGVLDYGQWYSARSIADGTNTGRRLMMGNIRSDITQVRLRTPHLFEDFFFFFFWGGGGRVGGSQV
eukprot:SAG31_NODE_4047_length_3638_cov_1.867477_3_plen_286_part_00